MRMYDIIEKKKLGGSLTKEEIKFAIEGFTKGTVPDYQMSALMMAIYFQGMNEDETLALTLEMTNSGDILDLSEIEGIKVDKHSTGGVGDKTSLVLAPMVAALNVPVAKMSGRGLGHTGGTIDKLESFPGFNTSISKEQFITNVNKHKIAIAGQTANLAPADKKLYALRDVTATVDQISLIASSIMSKKIASGSNGIVLDVKTGTGAFMRKEEDAIKLAKTMVGIGNGLNRNTVAIVSDMNQPLGVAVGNSLEVIEAIETLKGNGPEDLLELCLNLGSQMLIIANVCSTFEEGKKMLLGTIENGTAFNKFKEFIEAQGGDSSFADNTDKFTKATISEKILAPKSGYIKSIESEEIGIATMILGGGRETKESVIDLSVGIKVYKKVGDKVEKDEVIGEIFANDKDKTIKAKEMFLKAYSIVDEKVNKNKLIKAIVTKDGINQF